MNKKEQVFKKLDELKIPYEVIYHEAVFTIEEMNDLGISNDGDVVKNLFLRDAKGKRHFLVVMDKDKKADLQSIQQQLGSTVLSFASENRLEKFLQLTKGAVTPLGVINDTKALVEVIFDKELIGKTRLGVHPNDNRATIWISFDNLKTLIEKNGNDIKYISI